MSENTETQTADIVRQTTTSNNAASAITAFRNGQASIISSIEGDSFDIKLAVAEAVTTSEPLDEHLNKTINLANFVVQRVEMVNEQTGAVEDVPRTILIDDKGNAYHAISKGIFSGIENLVGIMGRPSQWEKPIAVEVVKQQARIGKVMVLRIVRTTKK